MTSGRFVIDPDIFELALRQQGNDRLFCQLMKTGFDNGDTFTMLIDKGLCEEYQNIAASYSDAPRSNATEFIDQILVNISKLKAYLKARKSGDHTVPMPTNLNYVKAPDIVRDQLPISLKAIIEGQEKANQAQSPQLPMCCNTELRMLFIATKENLWTRLMVATSPGVRHRFMRDRSIRSKFHREVSNLSIMEASVQISLPVDEQLTKSTSRGKQFEDRFINALRNRVQNSFFESVNPTEQKNHVLFGDGYDYGDVDFYGYRLNEVGEQEIWIGEIKLRENTQSYEKEKVITDQLRRKLEVMRKYERQRSNNSWHRAKIIAFLASTAQNLCPDAWAEIHTVDCSEFHYYHVTVSKLEDLENWDIADFQRIPPPTN